MNRTKIKQSHQVLVTLVLLLLSLFMCQGFAPVTPVSSSHTRRRQQQGQGTQASSGTTPTITSTTMHAASASATSPPAPPPPAAATTAVAPSITYGASSSSSSSSSTPPLKFRRSTPPKKQRRTAQVSTSYGLWDLLIGPVAADFKAVDMPSELTTLAGDVHRATSHLTRPERVAILEALIRTYHAYRLAKEEEKPLTVGGYMEQVTKVVGLLGACEVDGETIIAALLCQAPISVDEVEVEFGVQVGTILKGWKAMLAVESQLEVNALINKYAHFLWGAQGDNTRNLLLVVAKDWRAVALRVAWKKIEMEGPFKTKKDHIDACWACLNVYASLAESAGMSLIKNELEDRAFQFLMPQEHRRVVAQLDARKDHYERVLQQARKEVLQGLMEDEIFMNNVERVEVKGRIKSPYSVWKKMKRKGQEGMDELFDMVALRVVCTPAYDTHTQSTHDQRNEKDKNICDYVLHKVIHKLRPHYKGRVKNYVGPENAKRNGYQSLHTTLAYRLRGQTTPVEVQIRTSEMHSVAEHGLAAHVLYKGERNLAEVIEKQKEEGGVGVGGVGVGVNGGPTAAVAKSFAGKGDFLTWCQRMLDKSQVIVFDPDGRLLKMNRGATLLDFLKTSYGMKKATQAVTDTSTHMQHLQHQQTKKHQYHQKEHQKLPSKRKRSTQGRLLLNGQMAADLGRELMTGDVISYL